MDMTSRNSFQRSQNLEEHDERLSSSFVRFVQRRWSLWLNLNSSWSSRWWYATVHIVTATIGAGVLNLQSPMSVLGWELGIIALLWFIVFSLICYSQMVEMHEIGGRRFDRYRDLGRHLLGEKRGFWLVVPFQFIIIFIVDIVYIITAASSLKKIFARHADPTWPWALGFGSFQLLLSQLPEFTSLTFVSLIGAVTAIGYSTIVWITIVAFNRNEQPPFAPEPVRHDYPHDDDLVFRIFAALGQLVFACSAGQNIAVEIQATIPSTQQRPSKVAMWQGTLVAYVIIAFCYIPVAVAGYWLYGDQTPKQCLHHFRNCHLLIALEKPGTLIVAANVMLVLHLCGTYQIYAMPLFNSLEDYVENAWKMSTTFQVRLITRVPYVVITTAIAMVTSPYFISWEAAVGGLANIPTSYLMPCILWQKYRKPRRLSLLWLGNMFCIVFAVLVAITSTIGSAHNLSKYHYKYALP